MSVQARTFSVHLSSSDALNVKQKEKEWQRRKIEKELYLPSEHARNGLAARFSLARNAQALRLSSHKQQSRTKCGGASTSSTSLLLTRLSRLFGP